MTCGRTSLLTFGASIVSAAAGPAPFLVVRSLKAYENVVERVARSRAVRSELRSRMLTSVAQAVAHDSAGHESGVQNGSVLFQPKLLSGDLEVGLRASVEMKYAALSAGTPVFRHLVSGQARVRRVEKGA